MSIQYIPRGFWHSLSFAIVVLSVGLVYIAYRASSVSLETEYGRLDLTRVQTSLDLSLALEEIKELKSQLEKQRSEIAEHNKTLKNQLGLVLKEKTDSEELKALAREIKSGQTIWPLKEPDFPERLNWNNLDIKIRKAEESVRNIHSRNALVE